MFKLGRKRITLAVDIQRTNAFATILEDKGLFSNVSARRLESDKEFRIYEFEATGNEYDDIIDLLNDTNVRYKVRFFDAFGREMYIGLI
jgi:hypothetical protein